MLVVEFVIFPIQKCSPTLLLWQCIACRRSVLNEQAACASPPTQRNEAAIIPGTTSCVADATLRARNSDSRRRLVLSSAAEYDWALWMPAFPSRVPSCRSHSAKIVENGRLTRIERKDPALRMPVCSLEVPPFLSHATKAEQNEQLTRCERNVQQRVAATTRPAMFGAETKLAGT